MVDFQNLKRVAIKLSPPLPFKIWCLNGHHSVNFGAKDFSFWLKHNEILLFQSPFVSQAPRPTAWGLNCRVKIALMLITKKLLVWKQYFIVSDIKKMAKSSLSIYRGLHGVTDILKFAHVSMYIPWLSSFRHGDSLQTRVFERQSLILTHFLARNDQKRIKNIHNT